MADASVWLLGARIRTLPAAVVPVVVGTAAVAPEGGTIWWRFAAALVVSLALQVGTNYANDYSDGIRGTDDDRSGPARLVGSGLVPAKQVKIAAFASFGVAAIAGLTLALAVGPELFVVGAASILAGWYYTGGSNPYGYRGLGEIFVFVFFGLVATIGSGYVQPAGWNWIAVLAAIPVGMLATALLIANNLRDIPTDTESGKVTLAVRLGDDRTRLLFAAFLLAPFIILVPLAVSRPWVLLGLLALPLAAMAVRPVRSGAVGRELIPVLEATGRTQLVYGVLVAIGLWIG